MEAVVTDKNMCILITKRRISNPSKNSIIIYEAPTKLKVVSRGDGIHSKAFNTSIKSHSFTNGVGTIVFKGVLTDIGNAAFYNCSTMTAITIPDLVTNIGNQAFSGCSEITTLNIPNSVNNIGTHAFYNCSSLTSITIPNGPTTIDDYAFYNCSSLSSIIIPNSVASINYCAF